MTSIKYRTSINISVMLVCYWRLQHQVIFWFRSFKLCIRCFEYAFLRAENYFNCCEILSPNKTSASFMSLEDPDCVFATKAFLILYKVNRWTCWVAWIVFELLLFQFVFSSDTLVQNKVVFIFFLARSKSASISNNSMSSGSEWSVLTDSRSSNLKPLRFVFVPRNRRCSWSHAKKRYLNLF